MVVLRWTPCSLHILPKHWSDHMTATLCVVSAHLASGKGDTNLDFTCEAHSHKQPVIIRVVLLGASPSLQQGLFHSDSARSEGFRTENAHRVHQPSSSGPSHQHTPTCLPKWQLVRPCLRVGLLLLQKPQN